MLKARDPSIPQKMRNRKWWLLFLVIGLVIFGTTVGLSIYFTKKSVVSTTIAPITPITTTTNKQAEENYVLMLSTYNSTNVPMVIGINGKLVLHYEI